MTDDQTSVEVLRDLPRFVSSNPQVEVFRCDELDAVYLRPSKRLRLLVESTRDLQSVDLWRGEVLAQAGIAVSEGDSRAFARALVAQMAGHLTIRNLEHLVDAFQAEVGRAHLAREEALEIFCNPETDGASACAE